MENHLKPFLNILWRWKRPGSPVLHIESNSTAYDVAWSTFDAAGTALDSAKGKYLSKVHMLSPQWRSVYTLLVLESQVDNGGFHQFFTNARGLLDQHLLTDLDIVAGTPYVPIIRSAIHKYKKTDYRPQWKNIGKSWEYFKNGPEQADFEIEDAGFYSIEKDLAEYVGDFILKNWNLYLS